METGKIKYLLLVTFSILFVACGPKAAKTQRIQSKTKQKTALHIPSFNADSAFVHIEKQVNFGPRVPNTEAHKKCGNYLVSELERVGAKVYTQEPTLQGFEHKWEAKNIIGEFFPEKSDRIVLCSHWDSRHTSDQEKTDEGRMQAVDGASDGASGVGILLELARILHSHTPKVGIDIVFFDVEDQGTPSYKVNNTDNVYWCLGSQYWSANPHKKNYTARYGILLDMVGAKDAVFRRELYSMKYADDQVTKIWREAIDAGYSSHFSLEQGGAITDDHYYMNSVAKIPTVDIIQYDYSTESRFGHYWHTNHDNMDIIDTKTLKAVGQTITNIVFKEPF